MPNVMVALPNIGWAPSVQRRKVWLTPITRCRAVTLPRRETSWNLQGCPKLLNRYQLLLGRKFPILWRHLEEVLLLNKFFSIVDTCFSCEDIARQTCAMVPRWRFLATFLRPVFSASHVKHVSDPHPKATPCVKVWQTSNLRWLRLGEEKKEEEETTGPKYNGLHYSIKRPQLDYYRYH